MAQVHRRARRPSIRILGVSLIEALVAMAVMAFGMLAVMGVQTTLRLNGDISKQRSEATRIAERELERLRSFKDVLPPAPAVPGDPSLYWSQVAQVLGQEVDLEGAASNTTYIMNRKVFTPAGSSQKVISVEITWQDSTGNTQTVALGDTLAGAAPVLSGLVSMPAVRTSASQNRNRHPTIPPRAHDMGNGESAFMPQEGGTVAWTFDNMTGVITQVCTVVDAGVTSSSLTAEYVAALSCTATSGQFLSGTIRHNLRGTNARLLDGTSVYKPIPGGAIAWVIDNTQSRIIRSCTVDPGSTSASLTISDVAPVHCTLMDLPKDLNDGTSVLKPKPTGTTAWVLSNASGKVSRICPVPSATPTASLVAADVLASNCKLVNPPQFPVSPSNPDGALSAVDSENPLWPALPVSVVVSLTSVGHSDGPACFANPPSSLADAVTQHFTEYFCIVYPNTSKKWTGTTTLSGSGWTAGSDYLVCRYTTAASDTTFNTDHPRVYTNVSGNLINQNFLIISAQKSCPSDVPANPSAGDFVNSNTLQHQP